MSQAAMDAQAQKLGFPNYATFVAYHNKYQAQNQPQPQAPVQQAPAAPEQPNFLQSLVNSIPSSFTLINKVSQRYKKATGQ